MFVLTGGCREELGLPWSCSLEKPCGFRDLEQPDPTLGADPDPTKSKFGEWGSDALQWVRLERLGCSKGGDVPTAQDLNGKVGDSGMSR